MSGRLLGDSALRPARVPSRDDPMANRAARDGNVSPRWTRARNARHQIAETIRPSIARRAFEAIGHAVGRGRDLIRIDSSRVLLLPRTFKSQKMRPSENDACRGGSVAVEGDGATASAETGAGLEPDGLNRGMKSVSSVAEASKTSNTSRPRRGRTQARGNVDIWVCRPMSELRDQSRPHPPRSLTNNVAWKCNPRTRRSIAAVPG